MTAFSQVRVEAGRFLEVGAHILDIDTLRIVTSPDARLTPKGAAVLVRLAHAGGRTLGRDELLDDVWKGTCPTPDVLTQAVKDLRRALGDDLHAPQYIETLPRLGYRLIAPTRFLDQLPPANPQSVTVSSSTTPTATTHRWPGAAVLLVIALLVSLVLAVFVRTVVPSAPVATAAPRWQVDAQRTLTAEPGAESFPRISPDGSRVAYSVGDASAHTARIVQKSLDSSRVVRLTNVESGNEYYPVWSPDGSAIAFMRYEKESCKLVVVPPLGGAERVVDSCYSGLVNPFSWTSDSAGLVTTTPSMPGIDDLKIVSWPIAGGKPQWLDYQHELNDTDLDARYSPDGRWIAFRRGANPNSDLFVVPAAGGAVRQLTHLATRIRGYDWLRDGSALVFSSGQGGQQALNVVDVANGHVDALGVQPAEYPSASRDADTVVYEIPRVRLQLSRLVAADDKPVDLAPSTGSDSSPAMSPQNDDIAFVSDRSGSQQVWVLPGGSNEAYALTELQDPTLLHPTWRPDGARILVTARGPFGGRLVEIDVASRVQRALTDVADEDVRSGAYAGAADHFIAVVNAKDHRSELIAFESVDGKELQRQVLAYDVGRVDLDPATGAFYFTRITEPGLFVLAHPGDEPTLVNREISPSHLDGWRVLGDEVFYIAPKATGHSEIHAAELRGVADRVVMTLPNSLGDLSFAVAHDGRSVVVARMVAEDTDIGALRLRRAVAE
jgi:Tol biopolymer transport system component/DNA-binding winged helix-turn-helix (wHTH) protein